MMPNNSSQLKSCPHCGNSLYVSIEYSGIYEKFFVRCPKCRMSGPLVEDKHAAAEAWNSLPRTPKWTSESPTQPGWYFTRRNRPGKPLRVVYVKEEKRYDHRVKEERKVMTMSETRSAEGYIIEELNQDDRQWAGPINMPRGD